MAVSPTSSNFRRIPLLRDWHASLAAGVQPTDQPGGQREQGDRYKESNRIRVRESKERIDAPSEDPAE